MRRASAMKRWNSEVATQVPQTVNFSIANHRSVLVVYRHITKKATIFLESPTRKINKVYELRLLAKNLDKIEDIRQIEEKNQCYSIESI